MEGPLISLVITCYREGRLLLDAAASVEAQTDQDFEAIVVNDCSPDPETNEACRTLEATGRWRVIWLPKNGGLSAARNEAYRLMTGEVYIALDADDVLPPDTVRLVKTHFAQNPDADFVFGNYIQRDKEAGTCKVVDCSVLCDASGWLDPRKITTDWMLIGTSPCRKRTWEAVSGYSQEFANANQDMDFFFRVLKAGCRGRYLPETLYDWNRSAQGMCANTPLEVTARIFLRHLDLLDASCQGREARFDLMWRCVNLGRFEDARVVAAGLLKMGVRSRTVAALALLPPALSRWCYRARQRLRSN